MILRWYLPALLGTLLLGAGYLVSDPVAWMIPSLAVAATVTTARRCLRDHYLLMALLTGLAEGVWFHGRFVVPAIVLLFLAGSVRTLKRVFPLAGLSHAFVIAALVGFLERGLLTVFPSTLPGPKLSMEMMPFLVVGALLTGLVAVLLEGLVLSWSPLRYQFDRP